MPALFSPEWWSALAAIVVIDLVLAGDNALVIGLAARNVASRLQRRVILWGTLGAIVVRLLLTAVVVWLLRIPGFLLVGGIALVWIGWKLTQGGGEHHAIAPATTMRAAIQTIVVADAVMGVDNVLGVAGAAHGSVALVVLGLAISIPIVVYGSTLILRCIERFPALLYAGGAVLAWTAAQMIVGEPFVRELLAGRAASVAAVYGAIVCGVLGLAWLRNRRPARISMEATR